MIEIERKLLSLEDQPPLSVNSSGVPDWSSDPLFPDEPYREGNRQQELKVYLPEKISRDREDAIRRELEGYEIEQERKRRERKDRLDVLLLDQTSDRLADQVGEMSLGRSGPKKSRSFEWPRPPQSPMSRRDVPLWATHVLDRLKSSSDPTPLRSDGIGAAKLQDQTSLQLQQQFQSQSSQEIPNTTNQHSLTRKQWDVLEAEFQIIPKPSSAAKRALASQIGLTLPQISVSRNLSDVLSNAKSLPRIGFKTVEPRKRLREREKHRNFLRLAIRLAILPSLIIKLNSRSSRLMDIGIIKSRK